METEKYKKLKRKKAVENETETEKYFTTEITLIYRVHRAVIFAVARLSCSFYRLLTPLFSQL